MSPGYAKSLVSRGKQWQPGWLSAPESYRTQGTLHTWHLGLQYWIALWFVPMWHNRRLLQCVTDDIAHDNPRLFVGHAFVSCRMPVLMFCIQGTPLKLMNAKIRIWCWFPKWSDPISRAHAITPRLNPETLSFPLRLLLLVFAAISASIYVVCGQYYSWGTSSVGNLSVCQSFLAPRFICYTNSIPVYTFLSFSNCGLMTCLYFSVSVHLRLFMTG